MVRSVGLERGGRGPGAEVAHGDILVFLDDDAVAEPDWLEYLLAPFEDPHAVAVGGAPLPNYETARPRWFPANFDWVFGCAYSGMPHKLAPYPRLIGANMAVRTQAFRELGGFHSIDFDDLDLCMRLAVQRPEDLIMYEPRAIVFHFVPSQRVSWHYFWRRCFFVNREKVQTVSAIGSARSLGPETRFVIDAITSQLAVDSSEVIKGSPSGLARIGAMFVGIFMAAVGNIAGRIQPHSDIP